MSNIIFQDLISKSINTKNLKYLVYERFDEIPLEFFRNIDTQILNEIALEVLPSLSSDIKTKFVCVYFNENAVLLFPIQEIWLSRMNFPGLDRTFWQRIASLVIDFSCIHLLIAGNILQFNKNYLVYDSTTITELQAFTIHFEVLNALYEEKKYTSILINIPEKVSQHFNTELQNWQFKQRFPDIEMKLELRKHWVNWESYFGDLKKKYAARAKKIRQSIVGVELKLLTETEVEKLENELYLLYLQTAQKQDLLIAKASKNYFTSLKHSLGNKFNVKGFFYLDKLVGFYSYFEHEFDLEIHFIGVNYDLNHKFNIYFNILFEGLIDAIHLRKHTISYGRTCLDAKASVGAIAIPCHSYIKSSRFNKILTGSLNNYFNSAINNGWKDRSPLK